MKINSFRGEYRFLSNFWPVAVHYEGWEFPTVEHAYQAAKTVVPEERGEIQQQTTPGRAKKLGSKVTIRLDWDSVKVDIMLNLLRQKFADPLLKPRLLATGDAELVEGNTWGDTYWGVDLRYNIGENHLGKLLMQVREELRGGG
jgi:ribA/ribD-fused uncharacterized protein